MGYLLDTNVVSEMRKRAPDPNVKGWLERARSEHVFLSVLTLGEIRAGIETVRRRRDDVQANQLEAWLRRLHLTFEERIVGISAEIAEVWGRIKIPDPLPAVDGLLAATALVHDWTLVTRNTRHVERTGVRLVDPFESSP